MVGRKAAHNVRYQTLQGNAKATRTPKPHSWFWFGVTVFP